MGKMKMLLAAWIALNLVSAAAELRGQHDALRSIRSKKRFHHLHTIEWPSHASNLQTDPLCLTKPRDEFPLPQEQQADLITNGLPGQPQGSNFSQYSGYITVDSSAGRALFYYFTEAAHDPASKPLLLWLNGGPGCSSLGTGAMEELGPFRPNPGGKTLHENPYAWNQVANVLFLESPAGVGFSYSNTTSDYNKSGDIRTAEDSYAFLVNWFNRFPQYKSRDFYLTGESYAGNYIPELAATILDRKRLSNASFINLKGIMVGNGDMSVVTDNMGLYMFAWSHALISDQTYTGLMRYCTNISFIHPKRSKYCTEMNNNFYNEMGQIDTYNIYAPICVNGSSTSPVQGPLMEISVYDPCFDDHISTYLNRRDVQETFHVRGIHHPWSFCNFDINGAWNDSVANVLPIYEELISAGIRILVYCGDTDSVVPVTSTRLAIKALNLTIDTPWYAWANDTTDKEVYGYAEIYKGLTFATVRGAGHKVPSDQGRRALALVTFFLAGKPLPQQS